MSTTGLSAQSLGLGDTSKNILILVSGISLVFVIGFLFILLQGPFLEVALIPI